MNKSTKVLLKGSSSISKPNKKAKQILEAKKHITNICRGLSVGTQEYNPAYTVQSIKKYINASDNHGVVMYSNITSYIFNMDNENRGCFLSNLDSLLAYANEHCEIEEECKRFIFKIYDHTQLAISQVDNANAVFNDSMELAKKNLRLESESIKKEYIAILGIFAAVVIVFMSSTAFSTSILENIHKVSIYRISLLAVVLGFVVINTVYALLYYMEKIVHEYSIGVKPLMVTNVILILFMIFIFCAWDRGVVEHRNILLQTLIK